MLRSPVVDRFEEEYTVNSARTRAVAREQPCVLERAKVMHQSKQLFCYAEAARIRTGKASGWLLFRGGIFAGQSQEAAMESRTKWLHDYISHVPESKKCQRPEPLEGGELRKSNHTSSL